MQMVGGNGRNQFRQYAGQNVRNQEEAGIQLQAKKFDLMAGAADLDEIEEVNANCILMANLQQASTSGSGYHQKDRKPSQNDKTEHGMEKTVQNQGQSPKMPKSESILKNTIECNLYPSDGPGKPNSI
ncbi:hypothetical protein Tco_1509293, partial [Tanacetum coccineum]